MAEECSKKTPVIGVAPLVDTARESYWMLPGYFEMLEQFGAVPLMLPLTTDPAVLEPAAALCDGFLFTGGQDVEPMTYGAQSRPGCGETCIQRDAMEFWLLRYALQHGTPVLGICRGLQLINAALGGTLYQDLPTEHPGGIGHHMSRPYDRAVHTVDILPGTPLAGLLGAGEMGVNSLHHQGIETLAPGLMAAAVAPDGLVEAFCLPEHPFLMAVQWHPELWWESNPRSNRLVQAFVDRCREQNA